MEAIYKKKYTIQGIEVDFRQQLKLSSLFIYLQDMATEHAIKLGVGRNVTQDKYGVVWVLIRSRVDVIRYPKIGENITIETWPNQPGKLEFERNFFVYDNENNIIAKSISSWVLIDFNTRKLKRSSLIEPNFPSSGRDNAIDCQLGKLKSKGSLNIEYRKTVGYSDIDVNEHLNNAKYIDYIMDCFSMEKHKKYFVKSIEIDYIHEALPGDTIILKSDLTDVDQDIIYIEGVNDNTNKTSFKSQILIARSDVL
ncbi:MAG: thioesterase [Tissierellia bacterium]|nr:thioesterase [Tissierellia bacterium]MDD4779268.1 thioesterase [Tissierellia bacterium]